MSSEQNTTYGLNFTGVLQIVFIVLKLIDKINWPWWCVLLPTEISLAIIIVCIIIIIFIKRNY